jgi:hypothetical protein
MALLTINNNIITARMRPLSGQSRHFGRVPVTSDLHPTPDMSVHRNN